MKIASFVLSIVGALILTMGIGGIVLADEHETNYDSNRSSYSMWDQNFGNRGFGRDSGNRGFGRMGGMMGGRYTQTYPVEDQKLDLETLTNGVEAYIAEYNENLVIGDVFVFDDTDYYYSIVEEDTGMGAMELLVNPYTGYIFPEYGPNMMWNLKYGMHYARGKMGGRGMMGFERDDYFEFNSSNGEDNDLTAEEAYNEAMDHLSRYGDNLTVSEEYHEFYGYYTYHVLKEGGAVGMLSVNGLNGDVWYHDWHGELIEIIESHEDGHE